MMFWIFFYLIIIPKKTIFLEKRKKQFLGMLRLALIDIGEELTEKHW